MAVSRSESRNGYDLISDSADVWLDVAGGLMAARIFSWRWRDEKLIRRSCGADRIFG
jgi:hypothetical protein